MNNTYFEQNLTTDQLSLMILAVIIFLVGNIFVGAKASKREGISLIRLLVFQNVKKLPYTTKERVWKVVILITSLILLFIALK